MSLPKFAPIMSSMYNKLYLYFKNLYTDYSEVFKEARQGARKSPLRASLYGAATILVLNMFRTNEGLRSYTSEVVGACNRIGSVAESCRNPRSSRFVGQMGELNCHGLLRQVDLGFSTLIYKADTNPENALFRYNCAYLRPSIKEFFNERIIDLSILGHWLFLEFNMKDYDLNEEQYEGLSEAS